MNFVEKSWYAKSWLNVVLWPLSVLFRLLSFIRKRLYEKDVLKRYHCGVPVIVVGNISVGGTGKTPLVTFLALHLKARGFKVGIISRGYGGQAAEWPQSVTADSSASLVGDEPLLIARRTGCPLYVSPLRRDAVTQLLENHTCDIVLSDDGLQHYALARDLEVVVVDGVRRFGNGMCLPAGPLREPVQRLASVDFVVGNGVAQGGEYLMQLIPQHVSNLVSHQRVEFAHFDGQQVHAVAGIGHPARFFNMLREHGLQVIEHAFPDHHPYQAGDFLFNDSLPILMTEKDAVKCADFANDNFWFVGVDAHLDESFLTAFDVKLDRILAH